jgi:hypothetical protein
MVQYLKSDEDVIAQGLIMQAQNNQSGRVE